MSAQLVGQRSNGPPSSGDDPSCSAKAQECNKATDSMVVGDRSRMVVGTESSQPADQHHMVMAGPMKNWDPLFVVSLILGFIGTALTGIGLFYPFWFILYRQESDQETLFGLLESKSCPGAKELAKYLQVPSSEHHICYAEDSPYSLGPWVLAMQICGIGGLSLCVINIILQVVNFIIRPRRYLLHTASLYVMAAGGFLLMLAGHIGHHYAVWRAPNRKEGSYLRLSPLGPGLFHVGTLFSSWVCVLTHVSSHGPGPLSADTRFAHIYEEEPAVSEGGPTMLKIEEALLSTEDVSQPAPPPPPPTQFVIIAATREERKLSVHSTEV